MIVFALQCDGGHEFDAWFRNSGAYDRQHRRNLISCPECGSHQVEKALMAPRLGRSHDKRPAPMAARGEATPAPGPENAPTPDQVRHALQVLRRHVEQTCENVGERFSEEARRIHKGEAEARGIYGEATPRERRELSDEGIEIAAIPWVPSSDA